MALVLYSQRFSRASVAVVPKMKCGGPNMRREDLMSFKTLFNISTSSGELQSSKGLRAPVVFGEEDGYLLGSLTMEGLGLVPDVVKKKLVPVEAFLTQCSNF